MKKLFHFVLVLGLLLPSFAKAQGTKVSAVAEDLPKDFAGVLAIVEEMSAAVRQVKDFQCIFHRKEWKGGRQLPYEIAMQKWRSEPFSVYMKWIGSEKADQEIIYKAGWNDGKVRAHKGSFPDVTVNLDPEGSMAMANARHSVKTAGFAETLRFIQQDIRLAREEKAVGWKFAISGEEMALGEKVRCISNHSPGGSKYYADKARICMSLRTKLPIVVQVWKNEDGAVRLVEDYGYEACRINLGLTDKDFDPDNPEYKF